MTTSIVSTRIIISLLWANGIHLHTEAEVATQADSLRLYANFTATLINNVLNHLKTESNAFVIYGCGALEFAETCKQLGKVFSWNAGTRVFNVNDDSLFIIKVASIDHDLAIVCEFDGVFDKIDDHLFEAPSITKQIWYMICTPNSLLNFLFNILISWWYEVTISLLINLLGRS